MLSCCNNIRNPRSGGNPDVANPPSCPESTVEHARRPHTASFMVDVHAIAPFPGSKVAPPAKRDRIGELIRDSIAFALVGATVSVAVPGVFVEPDDRSL